MRTPRLLARLVVPLVAAVVLLAAASRARAGDPPAKVDLNHATLEQLMELPGVGDATAKKIVAGRPYASVDDLSKAGVPEKTIDKIRDLVTVGKKSESGGGGKPSSGGSSGAKGKVDLNRATADELMELPGVGEATAKKIVDGRPYASVDDVVKAGVSAKTLDKFRDLVTVGKSSSGSSDKLPAGSKTKIDLNQASADDLQRIPGVGEVTAQKIIDGRPYAAIEDLAGAGLSERLIEKIEPFVVITASKSSPKAAAPGGGHGLVWVNTDSGVYHKEGDRWYGRTKEGKYMTESAAKAKGYRASGEPPPDDDAGMK